MEEYLTRELLQKEYLFLTILAVTVLITYLTAVIKWWNYKRKSFLNVIIINIYRIIIVALCGIFIYLAIINKERYIVPRIFMLIATTRCAFWVKIENPYMVKKIGKVLWGLTIIAFILETCFWVGTTV